MALTDHVAILLGHSLDVARLNKKKTRSDFYAQVALPPAAAADVAALVSAIYPGIPLASIEVNFKTNAQQPKPFVGVPNDWFILRMASQFAPELFAADGVTRIANNEARSKFFAGMRVRVHSGAWAWKGDHGPAASFNLFGVMDAGLGGDRLQIGSAGAGAASAFASHANPNAVPQTGTPVAANPFGVSSVVPVSTPVAAPAASANPFAQTAVASNANPFAQQA